jgi:hypothetical protein
MTGPEHKRGYEADPISSLRSSPLSSLGNPMITVTGSLPAAGANLTPEELSTVAEELIRSLKIPSRECKDRRRADPLYKRYRARL